MTTLVPLALVGLVAAAPAAPPSSGLAPARETALPWRALWPSGAPGQHGAADLDIPALAAFLPAAGSATGAAVVVCPGGGYGRLAMDHEGVQIARWLNERGVAAFVLRYRLGPKYRHPIPHGDLLRAVRTVRAGAAADRRDPRRVGVWGFSAGGHLASTAATLFDTGNPGAADPIDRQSARPDFAILAYPVIFMTGEGTHAGSRQHLLGDTPTPELTARLSTNRQVGRDTPPTFLFHTADDPAVPVENALAFFSALRRFGVPAELHVYEHGRHGVGLAAADPVLGAWGEQLTTWLRGRGIVADRLRPLPSPAQK